MQIGHTLRSLRSMPRMVLGGVPSERAGEERLAWRRLGLQPGNMRLMSDHFVDGGLIPSRQAADGGNVPPVLRWTDVPPGTEALALLVEDPDAPTPNPFVHWLVYNIPAHAFALTEELLGETRTGRNSMFGTGWTGCAPPKGDAAHRYVFQLFALDRVVEIGDHPGRTALIDALRGHAIGCAVLTGTYQR
jgi:Raf kinase inhibitor-like YbhB/YbcL family protein